MCKGLERELVVLMIHIQSKHASMSAQPSHTHTDTHIHAHLGQEGSHFRVGHSCTQKDGVSGAAAASCCGCCWRVEGSEGCCQAVPCCCIALEVVLSEHLHRIGGTGVCVRQVVREKYKQWCVC